MPTYIILLRAIGAWTHKVMSMAQWRDGAAQAGFIDPVTYLASGNMILQSPLPIAEATETMDALVRQLGLKDTNFAVLRRPQTLRDLVAADPFPDASADHPSQMGVYFFQSPTPNFDWIADYDGHEKLAVIDNHLIIDFRGKISDSPALPKLIEKRCGAGTARNWNTLRGLAERGLARIQKD